MRLQRYLALCGIASRRKAEELIKLGEVKVNGKIVTQLGTVIDPDNDSVKYKNKVVKPEKKKYIVLNKPEGCVTTVSDDRGRKTVLDYVPAAVKERIYPVGRLDFNTTGCLIMTNDGDFANSVTHPKFAVEKYYTAKVKGRLTGKAGDRLEKGIFDGKKKLKAKKAGLLKRNEKNDIIYIIITEGVNHQVKKMLTAVGLSTLRLHRESVGRVKIKGLKPGESRELKPEEIRFFRKR